jgi:hypothetical protein
MGHYNVRNHANDSDPVQPDGDSSGCCGITSFATSVAPTKSDVTRPGGCLCWRPGWVEQQHEEWHATLALLLAQDACVMDGNFGATLDMRLATADTVVFFDLPPLLCLWRVLRRRFRYHGRARPDMAPGYQKK